MPTTRQRVGAAWAVSVWGSGSGERSRKVVSVQVTSRTWPLRPSAAGPGLQTDTQRRRPQGSARARAAWTAALSKDLLLSAGCSGEAAGPSSPQPPRACRGDSTARVSDSLHLSPVSSRAASVSPFLSMSHPSPEAWAQPTLAKRMASSSLQRDVKEMIIHTGN